MTCVSCLRPETSPSQSEVSIPIDVSARLTHVMLHAMRRPMILVRETTSRIARNQRCVMCCADARLAKSPETHACGVLLDEWRVRSHPPSRGLPSRQEHRRRSVVRARCKCLTSSTTSGVERPLVYLEPLPTRKTRSVGHSPSRAQASEESGGV